MKRRIANSVLAALLLIALATLLILLGVGVIDRDAIFFDGWWTVFIIVPIVFGLVNDIFSKNVLGIVNSVVFAGDLIFFFVSRFVFKLPFSTVLYIFAGVLIANVAIRIIFSPFVKRKRIKDTDPEFEHVSYGGENNIDVKFSSKNVDFGNREFDGVSVNVAFGAVKLDLRNATVKDGAQIALSVSFAGVEILLPPDVNVEDHCSASLGGVSVAADLEHAKTDQPTVKLTGSCSFGGIDVK